jgi:hypothetical protein
VPANIAYSSKGIFAGPLTVLTRQRRQAGHGINKSIFILCLWRIGITKHQLPLSNLAYKGKTITLAECTTLSSTIA